MTRAGSRDVGVGAAVRTRPDGGGRARHAPPSVVLAVALVAIAAAPAAASRPDATSGAVPRDFAARVDSCVAPHVADGSFMGAVLVARNGRVLFERGYGRANLEWDVPDTPRTRINLASVTKQFTGLAILQLVAAGKLGFRDSIAEYFAAAPPSWRPITIAELLSHTSGLPGVDSLAEFPKGIATPYTPDELLRVFVHKPLDFPPGTSWKYSNTGYYVLGYVIEKVSGEFYADYLRDHVFEPAGMHDSGYEWNAPIIPKRAEGYVRKGGRYLHADYFDMSLAYAAGALYSTAEDLLKWDRALAEGTVLAKRTLDSLFTPDSSGYHAGWFVRREHGRVVALHEGSNPGFGDFIARFPESRTLIVVLSNVEDAPVRRITREIEDVLWPAAPRARSSKPAAGGGHS